MSLKPPAQETATSLSFDTRPAAVDAWIDALPMGHVGEATRQVFSALRETNALEMEEERRFGLLEAVSAPLETLTASLRGHFDHNQLPLPPKSVQVARLSTDLLLEMAIGYRLVLDAPPPTSWFARRARRKRERMAAYRLLQYLGELLWNHKLLNTPTPEGAWHQIHRIYREAERGGWHRAPVPGLGHATLEGRYKETLLLQLLPIQHLSKPQIGEVRHSIGHWAEGVRLVEDGAAERAAFCLFPETDNPALPDNATSRRLSHDGLRRLLLEDGALDNELMGRLSAAAQGGGKTTLADGTTLSEATLRELRRAWVEPLRRGGPRELTPPVRVEMALGLTPLHHLLGGGDAEAETAPPAASGAGNEPPLTLADLEIEGPELDTRGAFVAATDDRADEWDCIYPSAETDGDSVWADDARPRSYHTITGTLLDHARDGGRIALSTEEVPRVCAGEVVGIHAGERWAVGSVRWIRQERSSEVQIGIQLHADAATPFELHVGAAGGGEDTPLRGLLGRLADEGVAVFLPNLPGLREKRLAAHYDGAALEVFLGKKVAASRAFTAFRAEFRGRATASMPPLLQSHLAAAGERAAKGESPSPHGDQYASIWPTL